MAVFSSALYTGATGAATGHGPFQVTTHLHATATLPATAVTNDTVNMGYLPANAVVFGVTLKAQTQLDSGAGLVFDVGDAALANRYMAGTILVGRAATASFDTTMAATGKLFKTTAKTAIIVKVNTQAGTPVAGVLELEVSYFVEDVVGSAP